MSRRIKPGSLETYQGAIRAFAKELLRISEDGMDFGDELSKTEWLAPPFICGCCGKTTGERSELSKAGALAMERLNFLVGWRYMKAMDAAKERKSS